MLRTDTNKKTKAARVTRSAVVTDQELSGKKKLFPEKPEDSVLFTSVHDGAMRPPAMNLKLPLQPTFIRSEIASPVATKPRYKGLCVSCAHHSECLYAKSDTGVWHCEMFE
jgi:hypothetical protein